MDLNQQCPCSTKTRSWIIWEVSRPRSTTNEYSLCLKKKRLSTSNPANPIKAWSTSYSSWSQHQLTKACPRCWNKIKHWSIVKRKKCRWFWTSSRPSLIKVCTVREWTEALMTCTLHPGGKATAILELDTRTVIHRCNNPVAGSGSCWCREGASHRLTKE